MVQIIKSKFDTLFNDNINFLLGTISNKAFYNMYMLKINNMDIEDQKQKQIIEIFKNLLDIINELDEYTNAINYLCPECYILVERIDKFIDYLMEASKLIYKYWHLGNLYCPENSTKYIKYRKQIILYVDYKK